MYFSLVGAMVDRKGNWCCQMSVMRVVERSDNRTGVKRSYRRRLMTRWSLFLGSVLRCVVVRSG